MFRHHAESSPTRLRLAGGLCYNTVNGVKLSFPVERLFRVYSGSPVGTVGAHGARPTNQFSKVSTKRKDNGK